MESKGMFSPLWEPCGETIMGKPNAHGGPRTSARTLERLRFNTVSMGRVITSLEVNVLYK